MDYYLGEIRIFAGDYAPINWHLCNGSALSIADYDALFTLIGTTYGGDGVTNFKLPDCKGRLIVGIGTLPGGSSYPLGASAGVKTVALSTASMPAHNHKLIATNEDGTTGEPGGNYLAASVGTSYADGVNLYSQLPSTPTYATLDQASCANTGGGYTHNNLQPYVTINYIIAVQGGIFPSPY